MTTDRLWLSPPHVSDVERDLLLAAFDSNWVAPVGPDLTAFEEELGSACGRGHVAALSSGTAGLHLALQLMGIDQVANARVVVPSFTFVATANAVAYTGASPLFIDSERQSWNIDVALLAENLAAWSRSGDLPHAVVSVDLYGQCANYTELVPLCAEYEIPLIADSAESLGASHHGKPAGSFGDIAAISFNGNKIITTSGGGALLSDRKDLVDRARHLATQAREPAAHYEHIDVGYNYRLSNLLAALGRGQLQRLPEMQARRGEINQLYRAALAQLPGIGFHPVAPGNVNNNWLTVITVDPEVAGASAEQLRLALEEVNIESRPAWKPMHMQPLFAGAEMIGGQVCEEVFAQGLCLPSGSAMTDADLDRVVTVIGERLPS